jgi:dienelactone hydrolase
MTRHRFAPAALLALLLFGCSLVSVPAAAQQPSAAAIAAVTQDPPADPAHPATMVEWSIPTHGAKMNAALYLASGQGQHGLVILLHGFAGYERNFDVAQSIRRAGWDALVFHYRGSWGSPGDFSFANAMQDTEAAIAYVRSPAVTSKYGIDPRRIVLLGHSMGGFMAAYAASHDPQIAGAILLAAWNIGATPLAKADARNKTVAEFATEMGPLRGCTPESLVQEIAAHAKAWDYTSFAPTLKKVPVLIVSTNDELRAANEALQAALQNAGDAHLDYRHFETDHGFSDKRIALQLAVVDWLGNLQGSANPQH